MKKIQILISAMAVMAAGVANASIYNYTFSDLNVAIPDGNITGIANQQEVGGIYIGGGNTDPFRHPFAISLQEWPPQRLMVISSLPITIFSVIVSMISRLSSDCMFCQRS